MPNPAQSKNTPASTTSIALSRALFIVAIIVCAASFIMLDRDWMKDTLPPIGPVDHTAACLTGAVGLTLLLFAAYRLRRQ